MQCSPIRGVHSTGPKTPLRFQTKLNRSNKTNNDNDKSNFQGEKITKENKTKKIQTSKQNKKITFTRNLNLKKFICEYSTAFNPSQIFFSILLFLLTSFHHFLSYKPNNQRVQYVKLRELWSSPWKRVGQLMSWWSVLVALFPDLFQLPFAL